MNTVVKDSNGKWRVDPSMKSRQLVEPSEEWLNKAAQGQDSRKKQLSDAEIERLAVAEILREMVDPAKLEAKIKELKKRNTSAVMAGVKSQQNRKA